MGVMAPKRPDRNVQYSHFLGGRTMHLNHAEMPVRLNPTSAGVDEATTYRLSTYLTCDVRSLLNGFASARAAST
jgi:hypothetical protein